MINVYFLFCSHFDYFSREQDLISFCSICSSYVNNDFSLSLIFMLPLLELYKINHKYFKSTSHKWFITLWDDFNSLFNCISWHFYSLLNRFCHPHLFWFKVDYLDVPHCNKPPDHFSDMLCLHWIKVFSEKGHTSDSANMVTFY